MKTLVIGASPKPDRYSNKAVRLLKNYGHDVVAIGGREAFIDKTPILKGLPQLNGIHTVTIYIGVNRQPDFYEYILNMKPKRVIFNPNTENDEFIALCEEKGIKTIENCTLVMLQTGLF